MPWPTSTEGITVNATKLNAVSNKAKTSLQRLPVLHTRFCKAYHGRAGLKLANGPRPSINLTALTKTPLNPGNNWV